MTKEQHEKVSSGSDSWDAYWKGTAEAEAWTVGGAQHPATRGFWGEFLSSVNELSDSLSLVDIGSGNGAVVEYALAVLGDRIREIHCVDNSESAIISIGTRFPQVRGHLADACSIPLESGQFDLVTSQFGAEYAGPEAFEEAARLLASGGRMALLAHSRESQIYWQYEVNLAVVKRVKECCFINLARSMFEAGFQALQGADRLAYDEAGKQFAPAVQELESIMTEHGEEVADGTLASLYQGVARIHGRIQHYDPQEVLAWLATMERELGAYEGRLASMLEVAIDEAGFHQICTSLEKQGLILEQSGPLLPVDTKIPLAWAIIAKR